MDLELGRFVLCTVGANNHACMQVLPSSKNKKQKVVIGDNTGVITCVGIRKGNADVQWQTDPARNSSGVSGLCIGGKIESPDKIYAAFGQTVVGVKKKGDEFFKFDTSLNEEILHIFVEEMSIWVTGELVMNVFESYVDSHYFQSPDRINHFMNAPIVDPEHYNTILACQDNFIRVLAGADVVYETPVCAPAMCVHMYSTPEDEEEGDGDENSGLYNILYGTDDGRLGQCFMDDQTVRKGFLLDEKKTAIKCIESFDMTHDGVDDIIVGRDDGELQVLSFEEQLPTPTQVFIREITQSVTSLARGNIMSMNQEDLVVSTYAGKVMAYTHEVSSNIAHIRPKTEEVVAREEEQPLTKEETQEEGDKAMFQLQSEIEKLTEKLDKEKEKYTKLSVNHIAVDVQFKVKADLKLIPEEACYKLGVEINVPIDIVVLQSTVPVMLLELENSTAMLARTPAESKDGNELLASFRCQDNVTRLEVKIRTVEGQHGTLSCYVVARQSPKTCQKVEFQIRPLSLHTKVHLEEAQAILKARPSNTLKFTGTFSLNDVHSWVVTCLPNVAPRLTTESSTLCFKSTFLGTVLKCEYRQGEGTFTSDSITVISILKEVMTREATARKIQINISLDLKDESTYFFLDLLRPELDHHFSLAKKHTLIDALKEIEMYEENIDFLADELKEILKDQEQIKKEVKVAPRHLDFLKGIVTDLFVDKHKLRGQRMEKKMPMLLEHLNDYNFEALVSVFRDL